MTDFERGGRPSLAAHASTHPLTAPAVSPVMICHAATKLKISGGIAIRLAKSIPKPARRP